MIYFHLPKIAYYHIHKTGGTSFKAALCRVFPDHQQLDPWSHHPLAYYVEKLRKRSIEIDRIKIIATIRDPLHHVVSIYHYWRQFGNSARPNVQAAKQLDFNEFVRFYVRSRLPDCRVYDELLLVAGEIPLSVKLVRLERWRDDIDSLGDPWTPLIQLPHLRRSEHQAADLYHNIWTTRLICDRYRWVYSTGLYPLPAAK